MQNCRKESFGDYFAQKMGKSLPLNVEVKDVNRKVWDLVSGRIRTQAYFTHHAFYCSTLNLYILSMLNVYPCNSEIQRKDSWVEMCMGRQKETKTNGKRHRIGTETQ